MRASVLLLAVVLLGAVGCESVRPWERDVLARTDMAWDPDPLESALEKHIEFSKEGSLDGGAAGGGGCGCN
ncbi:MAG: DUF4266 domain-containing protein [Myxococcota bacterium]